MELRIAEEVYVAAMARARSQNNKLAAVARFILLDIAGKARPVEEGAEPAPRPPMRAYGDARCRLRLEVPEDTAEKVKSYLHRSGSSVAQELERRLDQYAKTGNP